MCQKITFLKNICQKDKYLYRSWCLEKGKIRFQTHLPTALFDTNNRQLLRVVVGVEKLDSEV